MTSDFLYVGKSKTIKRMERQSMQLESTEVTYRFSFRLLKVKNTRMILTAGRTLTIFKAKIHTIVSKNIKKSSELEKNEKGKNGTSTEALSYLDILDDEHNQFTFGIQTTK